MVYLNIKDIVTGLNDMEWSGVYTHKKKKTHFILKIKKPKNKFLTIVRVNGWFSNADTLGQCRTIY